MRTTGILGAAALTALALLVPPASGSATAVNTSFASQSLGSRLHFVAYLPDGYATSGLRYPVVYFLHGLPAAPTSYESVGFVERALEQARRPAILVVPQGVRPGESDPEWANHGAGDDWAGAVAVELVRVVDARFRTIPTRAARALVGVSAGGYGAMNLAISHLDRFGVVESWSGYFHPTDPTGTRPVSLGSAARDADADVHRQLAAKAPRLRSGRLYIAFYVGRDDARFVAENEELSAELTRAGVPHVFRIYPGGHTQKLWEQHAKGWLQNAVCHLQRAS